jgi:hypothetical protein
MRNNTHTNTKIKLNLLPNQLKEKSTKPSTPTHHHSLHTLNELVKAVEDELRGKLPLACLLALGEVLGQLHAVLLVRPAERAHDAESRAHLLHCLLHLALEDLGRLEEVTRLQESVGSSLSRIQDSTLTL